jgi:hypothetical protein
MARKKHINPQTVWLGGFFIAFLFDPEIRNAKAGAKVCRINNAESFYFRLITTASDAF